MLEVDERGRFLRQEVFAADRLGDAIARLYERYAELLPDGPERERAAATARSLGTMLTAPRRSRARRGGDRAQLRVRRPPAPEHLVDARRRRVPRAPARLAERSPPTSSSERTRASWRSEPSALLIRRMHSGTERVGGGAYERPFLVLFATDADGRLARAEWFDADREAEALARFDALIDVGSLPFEREVRRDLSMSHQQIPLDPPFSKGEARPAAACAPNAATACWARIDAAFAARDVDAVDACFSDSFVEIDHTTGSRRTDATGRSRRSGAPALDPIPRFRHEALATLGDVARSRPRPDLARAERVAAASTSAPYEIEDDRGHRGRRRAAPLRRRSSPATVSATPSPASTSATPSCCPKAPSARAPRRRRARSRWWRPEASTALATRRYSAPTSRSWTTSYLGLAPASGWIRCSARWPRGERSATRWCRGHRMCSR